MIRSCTAPRQVLLLTVAFLVTACASGPDLGPPPDDVSVGEGYNYIIGPLDSVGVFVWRNSELSWSGPIRPDGMFSTPLIEDVVAAGKTSTELAREMEDQLAVYLKNPVVTVLVTGFVGPYDQQVRIVGQATDPQSIAYIDEMTALDVMIAVGGLNEFASGNKTILIRREAGGLKEYGLRLDDLLNDGDVTANAKVLPGDTLIIPEAWF